MVKKLHRRVTITSRELKGRRICWICFVSSRINQGFSGFSVFTTVANDSSIKSSRGSQETIGWWRGAFTSLVSLLISIQSSSGDWSRLRTMIFAGFEITACTLTWIMWDDKLDTTKYLLINPNRYELSRKIEDQQKLRAEIDAVRVKRGEDAVLTSNDYDTMHFLNACIKVRIILPESSARVSYSSFPMLGRTPTPPRSTVHDTRSWFGWHSPTGATSHIDFWRGFEEDTCDEGSASAYRYRCIQ